MSGGINSAPAALRSLRRGCVFSARITFRRREAFPHGAPSARRLRVRTCRLLGNRAVREAGSVPCRRARLVFFSAAAPVFPGCGNRGVEAGARGVVSSRGNGTAETDTPSHDRQGSAEHSADAGAVALVTSPRATRDWWEKRRAAMAALLQTHLPHSHV